MVGSVRSPRLLVTAAACVVVALVLGGSAHAVSTATTVRPISDFVSAQGSVIADFGPVAGGELSVGAIFLWGNDINQTFAIDYAGTFDQGLIAVGGPNAHTWFSGNVTERPLPDGRAEDTIRLVTHNAIAFVVDASGFPTTCTYGGFFHFSDCPALFGYNLPELANGVGLPVLVNSVMNVTLVNTAPGAPIPDLFTLSDTPSDSGAYWEAVSLKATAVGPLRAEFGVPDGTPGIANLDTATNFVTNTSETQISLRPLGK